MHVSLRKQLIAEFIGTAILVTVVVGSGVMGTNLTDDTAVALLVNAVATVAGLGALIWIFGPISGAHFNPVVTLWAVIRGSISAKGAWFYGVSQITGAIVGAILANIMFGLTAFQVSTHQRVSLGTFIGEVVATSGLLTVIALLGKNGRSASAHLVVPAWIGSAYFFTSSTSFANPAVTIGRIFSNTFAGIAPSSAMAFIIAQIVGLACALGLLRALAD
ncbi:unannotated protein [freshwater metagenome]|uniref:Unannotated protein n=1 Tax=freshwater metagenome TaxID=449393 RepID=A0A6J5ZVI8_9ZZZZ